MGAPIGNHNGSGKKGRSGRKGSFDERATYAFLADLWFTVIDKRKINAKIASGKFSAKDMLLKLIADGNDKVLIVVFNKVFPDTAMARQYGYYRPGKIEEPEMTPEEKAEFADLVDRAFGEQQGVKGKRYELPITLSKLLQGGIVQGE